MHPVALQSRLRAKCKNSHLVWTWDDTNAQLAQRLVDAGRWDEFAEKYSMRFNPDTGEFVDLGELAYRLAFLESQGVDIDPLIERASAAIRGLGRSRD